MTQVAHTANLTMQAKEIECAKCHEKLSLGALEGRTFNNQAEYLYAIREITKDHTCK